jgi:hypothetical protein
MGHDVSRARHNRPAPAMTPACACHVAHTQALASCKQVAGRWLQRLHTAHVDCSRAARAWERLQLRWHVRLLQPVAVAVLRCQQVVALSN